ncbi:hypothetical protein AAP_04512 [Ascosphaera apis ARSEF 7405]|uniref:Uncharacterized protein n=1 Tax=Ascosphaera apis ARSEF 7405 TaxID=392613 RepID=A0A167WM23_9EURO|nr:hypothetical protein AAP_04512 [Ascosphaera apis ARSEF 7405]
MAAPGWLAIVIACAVMFVWTCWLFYVGYIMPRLQRRRLKRQEERARAAALDVEHWAFAPVLPPAYPANNPVVYPEDIRQFNQSSETLRNEDYITPRPPAPAIVH